VSARSASFEASAIILRCEPDEVGWTSKDGARAFRTTHRRSGSRLSARRRWVPVQQRSTSCCAAPGTRYRRISRQAAPSSPLAWAKFILSPPLTWA